MKKVIFISALAIAAAVSCTKSDIVDTKFNEQISFENYIGRDAMTKGAVTDDSNINGFEIGLYGYYTGAMPWKMGDEANVVGAIENPAANLWDGDALAHDETKGWYTADTKYWTNDSDYYSFLAYAPMAADDNGVSVAGTNANNVNVTYTCPVDEETTELTTSVDLLYTQVVNTTKKACNKTVNLALKHALSRVTVKAYAPENEMEMQFDVKNVTLSGTYTTTGTLNLAGAKAAAGEVTTDAGWSVVTETEAKYVFYNNDDPSKTVVGDNVSWDVLPTTFDTAVDYAFYAMDEESGKYVEGTEDAPATNYLMMIPTDFKGTLSVTYTTIFGGHESNPMTKELELNTNFMMGKAYAITLAFEPVLDVITFNVTVDTWGNEIPVLDDTAATEEDNTPRNDNPENTPWTEPQA